MHIDTCSTTCSYAPILVHIVLYAPILVHIIYMYRHVLNHMFIYTYFGAYVTSLISNAHACASLYEPTATDIGEYAEPGENACNNRR